MPRLLLVLLALFAAVAYLVLAAGAEAGKGMPPYSVYSNERNGLATAARVLRRLGFTPVALTRPIQQTRHQGLLVVVEPRRSVLLSDTAPGLGEKESRALLDWVSRGNTLVLMSRHSSVLHELLGVGLGQADQEPAAGTVRTDAAEVGGYTAPGSALDTVPVHSVVLEGKQTFLARKGVPLWLVGNEPGALLVPHGEGRVLLVADPSVWTHRGLLRGDNVLLLYNVAALDAEDRRVYFDEYHHGLRSGGGYWDYLRYHDLHWDVLQLLAVVALGCWAVGVRLGPAIPLPRPARADAVDYASAVARIYQYAGVQHLLAQTMARDFLGALTSHLRLRRVAQPAQILAAWKQRHGQESAGRLAGLLQGVAELRRVAAGQETSERELLAWSRQFDDFVDEHELARRADGRPPDRP